MFLLVTGASGAGKSTVRTLIAPELGAEVDCVELGHVVPVPAAPTIAWRQQATEAVVRRALAGQREGRDLLLAGDPVAAGELLACPSADQLDGIAACLLDLDANAQTARLTARGDDPALLTHHLAFAEWMRGHARDPRHRPEVLTAHGWDAMHWERWTGAGRDPGGWSMHVLDTSRLSAPRVAAEVLDWCRRVRSGGAPVLTLGGPRRD